MSTCRLRTTTTGGKKKQARKWGNNKERKKIVKGEKKQRDEEKSGSSTCRSAYAYAVSRVSNPGEGLALLLVVEAVEPGVVTNVFVNFQWMERKKKNRSKVLIATVDWPTYIRKDLSRFELIRVVFFIRFYDNFQRPPFSIRSMDSDTDNSTSNYYSRAMKKKKCNLEPVFTLIGRSVDTIVNEDRTNHRVFSVSIVINAQETRGGPLRAFGPR